MNVCTACWQGNYVDGVCNRCQHKEDTDASRRSDALPLMSIVNNRYIIGTVLGKGGFGITYSAWDNAARRRVALKELFPNTSVTRTGGTQQLITNTGHGEYFNGMKAKFREEARLLHLIQDSCDIIRVYDLFECNNTVYYAMEFLEGCDLNEYRKRNGIVTWEFLCPIMERLLRTLSVLHKQNLIHRDISPDNIFLLKDNSVRLIDFGSARTYQGKHNFTVQKKEGFAPLEQLGSTGNQGPWTDIYSLSVTMYLLLSGKLPPTASDRSTGKAVIPLKQLNPNVPDIIAAAIEKGMSVRIADRFQSAEAFMRALGMHITSGPEVPPSRTFVCWLYGHSGVYAGRRKQLALEREITMGRKSTNDVVFPESTVGVSRQQCVLLIRSTGEMFIRDAGSTYGTFLDNQRVGASWVRIQPGSKIRFGWEAFELFCREQEM